MTRAPGDASDRRQYPRVRLVQPRHGEALAAQAPFALKDVSLGGFCVEAPFPFETGTEHRFEFTLSDRRRVELIGTVMHCLRVNVPGAPAVYLVGFAVPRSLESDRLAIATLLESARSAEPLTHAT